MAYRNGTYVAFHAGGTGDPITTDIKYYNLLKAWKVRDPERFYFIDSHEKTSAVRDSSQKETLRRRLVERLNNSKNMILIIGPSTARDTDWVPFEISYAVDTCGIPVVAAYIGRDCIQNPQALSPLWPSALHSRINAGTASVIHVPFKQRPLADAASRFSHQNLPNGGLVHYTREAFRSWGIPC